MVKMQETEALHLITAGLSSLSIESTAEQQEALWFYLQQLQRWNAVYNLTGIRDPKKIIIHHFFDSLTLLPYLQGDRVLDVGSGAGFPGMVLALFDQQRHYTLLDSNGKKTRFLMGLQSHWRMPHVSIVNDRLENMAQERPYSSIVSRAFSDLNTFIKAAGPRCEERGCLLAMKGNIPTEALALLDPTVWQQEVIPLSVPYLTAQRHLVMIRPS